MSTYHWLNFPGPKNVQYVSVQLANFEFGNISVITRYNFIFFVSLGLFSFFEQEETLKIALKSMIFQLFAKIVLAGNSNLSLSEIFSSVMG